MSENLSPNASAILLLTARLALPGENASEGVPPLTAEEYTMLARRLWEMKKTPGSLLRADEALLESCSDIADPGQIKALVGRSAEFCRAQNLWKTAGIWALTRADAGYPQALKQHLREDAPPVIWGCGNPELLSRKAFAVLGDPSKNQHYERAGEKAGELAAYSGFSVISTGDEGAGAAALRSALKVGGAVVQIPDKPLFELARHSGWKKLIDAGKLILVTPADPITGAESMEEQTASRMMASGLAETSLLVNTESDCSALWLSVETMLREHPENALCHQSSIPETESMKLLSEYGVRKFPEMNGVVDFHAFVIGGRKAEQQEAPKPVPLSERKIYEEKPPERKIAVTPEEKKENLDVPELHALRKEVQQLVLKNEIPAEAVLAAVIEELTHTGKMDPVVATVIRKVSLADN